MLLVLSKRCSGINSIVLQPTVWWAVRQTDNMPLHLGAAMPCPYRDLGSVEGLWKMARIVVFGDNLDISQIDRANFSLCTPLFCKLRFFAQKTLDGPKEDLQAQLQRSLGWTFLRPALLLGVLKEGPRYLMSYGASRINWEGLYHVSCRIGYHSRRSIFSER